MLHEERTTQRTLMDVFVLFLKIPYNSLIYIRMKDLVSFHPLTHARLLLLNRLSRDGSSSRLYLKSEKREGEWGEQLELYFYFKYDSRTAFR